MLIQAEMCRISYEESSCACLPPLDFSGDRVRSVNSLTSSALKTHFQWIKRDDEDQCGSNESRTAFKGANRVELGAKCLVKGTPSQIRTTERNPKSLIAQSSKAPRSTTSQAVGQPAECVSQLTARRATYLCRWREPNGTKRASRRSSTTLRPLCINPKTCPSRFRTSTTWIGTVPSKKGGRFLRWQARKECYREKERCGTVLYASTSDSLNGHTAPTASGRSDPKSGCGYRRILRCRRSLRQGPHRLSTPQNIHALQLRLRRTCHRRRSEVGFVNESRDFHQ